MWGPPSRQTLLGVVASEVEPPHAPYACGATWLESDCYLGRLTPQLVWVAGWQAFVLDSSVIEGSFFDNILRVCFEKRDRYTETMLGAREVRCPLGSVAMGLVILAVLAKAQVDTSSEYIVCVLSPTLSKLLIISGVSQRARK